MHTFFFTNHIACLKNTHTKKILNLIFFFFFQQNHEDVNCLNGGTAAYQIESNGGAYTYQPQYQILTPVYQQQQQQKLSQTNNNNNGNSVNNTTTTSNSNSNSINGINSNSNNSNGLNQNNSTNGNNNNTIVLNDDVSKYLKYNQKKKIASN